jgi:RNA polymerase sigma-70 factor (ECF subfamily)
MTDQELVQAYLDGNNHAFDELLARNQDNIFGYIIKVVEDEELANELFQETFLKIISKLQNHQYTETGRLQWWMLRVAHNVVIDYYRDQKKIFVVDAPKENDLSAVKSDELVDVNRENELTNQRTLKQLVLLMNALPAPQREVVYMRYFQDMSFKEIAEEVGCSINTSLGRMHYALINMRKLLRQYNINLCLE